MAGSPSHVLSVERERASEGGRGEDAGEGRVATVWLDRPDARNALGPEFFDELLAVMTQLSSDPDVRVVVIAARGRDFSVGLDLKAMGTLLVEPGGDGTSRAARAASARRSVLRMQAAISSVADCPKPVIAAVHGYCIGGGMDLVTACDVRLAATGAIFGIRETRMAIVADLGTLQRLPRIVAAGHVAELAYTGKDFDAARAEQIGLVNEVFDDRDELLAAAGALAREIASLSPLAVQG
ncbi:MAG TPA: enoyl-CoA hydratase-related protein, partial [Acidimicrobiales bacterium]|nr:enoyl-CoA hydratase-related protein [Acidimicrobiales bacterium]